MDRGEHHTILPTINILTIVLSGAPRFEPIYGASKGKQTTGKYKRYPVSNSLVHKENKKRESGIDIYTDENKKLQPYQF